MSVRPSFRAVSVPLTLAMLFCSQPVYAQTPELEGQPKALRELLIQTPSTLEGFDIRRQSLTALYTARNFKPAWNTHAADKKEALTSFVDTMAKFRLDNGLEEDEATPALLKKLVQSNDAGDHNKLEILITDWLLDIAHQLYDDGINLSQLYVGWSFKKTPRNLSNELAVALSQDKVAEFFETLVPNNMDYRQLAEGLKKYREMRKNGNWPFVPVGAKIEPLTSDPRIPVLRARLQAEGFAVPEADPASPELYDEKLKDVVIAFQLQRGLEADGVIGPKTFDTLNFTLGRRINQIRANMERLRHMPTEMPEKYVVVNIADASVKIIDKGNIVYHEPVVVGRPDRKTPFIQSAIRSIIFNPSWHVPAKIAREDILPKLRKDPHYLEKMGFVINTEDENDPYGTQIDWKQIQASEFAFRLRQAPGDLNSLGKIKFDFDNRFSVYMHGTPHEELFAKAARHLSSGCIRLKEPEQFAVYLLDQNKEKEWTRDAVQGEVDKRKTHWMQVSKPLPLYIIYQTAFYPTGDGPIHFRKDIYDYDRILVDAMDQAASARMLAVTPTPQPVATPPMPVP